MSGLNPSQLSAVQHRQGPLLVLAGAGTGKTRVITFRIAELIRGGVAPERILAVTFTNKAANEMQERLGHLLPPAHRKKGPAERPLVSTFHSLCVRILRRHIERLGYPRQFVIYSGGDQESVARSVLREINAGNAVLSPGQLVGRISGWKSRRIYPAAAHEQAESDRDLTAAIGFRRYQQELKRLGAVDFDDLLLLTEDLFGKFPEVLEQEAGRFDQILVDEYQDANESQYRIVKALAARHRNLCVVGDDDQSIYGWRGAEVRHILGFRKDWPDAVVVRLEENYRSCHSIIARANTLIRFNRERHEKTLVAARPGGPDPAILQFPDETAEARSVVADIAARLATGRIEPRQIAILFRTNEQPRLFEEQLRRLKLPYVLVGASSFFDRKEVQDILAWLRLVAGSNDDATALRVLSRPRRGVGERATEAIVAASHAARRPVWQVIADPDLRPELGKAAVSGLDSLVDCIESARRRMATGALADAARWLIEESRYRQEVDRCYEDASDRDSRWNTVQQVVNSLAEWEQANPQGQLHEFLDATVLGDQPIGDDKDKQLRRNAIAMMTLHSAKGLEFSEVYMVGMEEGLLPHYRALSDDATGIPEERRLCYVGVTRAQDRLTLTMSLTRMKWGKPRDSVPSRFLYELTGQAEHPNYRRACTGQAGRDRPAVAGAPSPPHAAAPTPKPGTRRRKD